MSPREHKTRLLIADDDDSFREVMSGELERRGYEIVCAPTGRSALHEYEEQEADVILLDLRLPDMDGIEVLESLSGKDAAHRVVVLTGHGTIDTAIQAIRLGAYDYLEKPCPVDEIEIAVQKAHEHRRLIERQRVLEDGYSPPDVEVGFVGASEEFRELKRTIAKVASVDATTLVLGETGVGKEMVSTLLHRHSPRRDRPFVVVDCAALHQNLLQNELFGHEKGAYTGAERQKHGLFEVANGGTLFLDEVGDTSPEVQAKLLRVLETGRFRRLGGNREIAVDVRVISATNRNLRAASSEQHFRRDLFFRLSTLTIQISPLRQRPEDIAVLIEHFTGQFNRRFSRSRRFSAAALATLLSYPWPGNVRELIHVVEQAILLSEGESIEPHELPLARRGASPPEASEASEASGDGGGGGGGGGGDEFLPLKEVERRHVLSALEKAGGNKTRAARLLEISTRNLYRLLSRYDEREPGPTSDA